MFCTFAIFSSIFGIFYDSFLPSKQPIRVKEKTIYIIFVFREEKTKSNRMYTFFGHLNRMYTTS